MKYEEMWAQIKKVIKDIYETYAMGGSYEQAGAFACKQIFEEMIKLERKMQFELKNNFEQKLAKPITDEDLQK